ncbi:hypothetical protein [Pedobacter jeongneungensis]|uniref:hypothetical protein n=1 Tax=Pedobacter jeongneungensis TaxID=947309 RepID=UPI0031D72F17
MKSSYHIVLISSGQPSLNPRLVKEADSLKEAGYTVTVIYQYWNEWGTALDMQLLQTKKWKSIRVGGDPSAAKFVYLKSRIRQKLAMKLSNILGFGFGFAETAITRCLTEQTNFAQSIKADLYIAHNLGALPAAVSASKKNKAKCGFDAEDFHRYEVTNNKTSLDYKIKKYIEDKYLAQVDYLTTSSPLISAAYQECYPQLKPITLLNVFPQQHISMVDHTDKPLQLFWFSQTIGSARGLETVIDVINHLDELAFELHLLGNHDVEIIETFNSRLKSAKKSKIFYHRPIPADEIFKFASQFDIGLATELSYPENRDICLTNKIFTYVQAGLAIIATDTSAQSQLLENYPHMGDTYENGNIEALKKLLTLYANHREKLAARKKQALTYGNEKLNWNLEQQTFLELVANTLAN